MPKLLTVNMSGTFRGHDCWVVFRRLDDGWRLTVTCEGQVETHELIGRSHKPCWTVACKYLDEPKPGKNRAPRVEEKPDTVSFRAHAVARGKAVRR